MSSQPTRVLFMGTPQFAVPCVEALAAHASCELVGVVCQPDKRHGRHKTPQPPPVKVAAIEAGAPVFQPRKIKSGDFPEQLKALNPELIVVAAYGRILPPYILEMPRLGCINLHASLLPRWRGAAPIQWCIWEGDAETGVCLMDMEEGLDTGGVYGRVTTPIHSDDTGQSLHDRLSQMSGAFLSEQLDALIESRLKPNPQDHSTATYAPMLARQNGQLDWCKTAKQVSDHIRGFFPWPGAFTTEPGGKMLKLFPLADVHTTTHSAIPGTIIDVTGEQIVVACGEGAVSLDELQLEGRKRMRVSDLLRGFELKVGMQLGNS
ncbi:MAG TPA: methionyl-tRNA formyltransferase [Myxococcales bacterium]|nr:methionyl-tRNA formyltransferase [Myxococcales bacterium]